ncbi:MAG: biotin-independent malonate decarboxylase subunit gamma [Vulcanimicrobiaceae bacterium]
MSAGASRGRAWFELCTAGGVRVAGLPSSVLVADAPLDGHAVRWIAIVAAPEARFARARSGEMGIDEAFGVAAAVRGAPPDSAIVALVDVPGQAFGVREEAIGLQRALAASVEAYVHARRSGHPVAALIVGKAISGAFLAHGIQAGWIGALTGSDIEVHVMSEPAVARVTRMQRSDLAAVASQVPATARDIVSFARFGAIDALFEVADPLDPTREEYALVVRALGAALRDGSALRSPAERLDRPSALKTRALARRVRDELAMDWDG